MLQYLDLIRRLRTLFDYPEHDQHLLPDIATATSQEIAEVIAELKRLWAWWVDRPVDDAKLQEELADVQFFLLLWTANAQDHQVAFDLEKFTQRSAVPRAYRNPQKFHQTVTERRYDDLLDIMLLMQRCLASGYPSYVVLLELTTQLQYAVTAAGMTEGDFERAFLRKFAENINRTGKRYTPEGTLLYHEIDRLYAQSEVRDAAQAAGRINRMVA